MMNNITLPRDCIQQWDLLLLLISSEEQRFDKTSENEIDMMTYFYRNEGIRTILLQWLIQMKTQYAKHQSTSDTAVKSDDISLLWRQRGNEKFKNSEFLQSYNCYTKSILYAKPTGDMYPLALANRSATLIRMKQYEDCLSDIQLALKNGYPTVQRHKLYLRQADCYMELGYIMNAKESISAAKEHAETLQISPNSTNEFKKHMKILEKKLDMIGVVKKKEIKNEKIKIPKCHLGDNPDFVCASAALELKRSDGVGRHVTINADVDRGAVMFVEDPYAFVTLPHSAAAVCETCCRYNINVVPCIKCSRSVFCSEKCRQLGWDMFHQWECVGAQSRLWPTIGIAHLALRVLLISTFKGFPELELENVSKTVTVAQVFESYSQYDTVKIYSKNMMHFLRVFNLVTNFNKMGNTDYIQYALTAVMLTTYLDTFTHYFDYLRTKIPFKMSDNSRKMLVASLLLRHMGQLVSNGHAVMALQYSNEGARTISEKEIRLATAIYPSASMMNHSCDPNIINCFAGAKLIIRASRALSAGSELCNCYGPNAARETASDRRAHLRAQYMFNCECSACLDPQRKDFVLLFMAYACQFCKGPVLVVGKNPQCQQCRSTDINLESAVSTVYKADEILKNAENAVTFEDKCELMLSCLKMKQQVLHRHHNALRDIRDRLACLYAEMGEFNKSIEFIKQNIPSLEYQFGSFSVEVAHELRKLSAVMMERILSLPNHADFRDWCLETHKILKKALQLLHLNYGSWEPLSKQLIEQEEFVAKLVAESRRTMSSGNTEESVHNMLHYNLKI